MPDYLWGPTLVKHENTANAFILTQKSPLTTPYNLDFFIKVCYNEQCCCFMAIQIAVRRLVLLRRLKQL